MDDCLIFFISQSRSSTDLIELNLLLSAREWEVVLKAAILFIAD